MRPLVTKALPERPGEQVAACADAPFYLDDTDRVVVATADRHVLVVETADAGGDADLTTRAGLDLAGQVPADDCLVGLVPDGHGRIWFATRQGRVGAVDVHRHALRAAAVRGRASALVLTSLQVPQEDEHGRRQHGDPAGLAERYSHPVWLVGRWLEVFGPEGTERLPAPQPDDAGRAPPAAGAPGARSSRRRPLSPAPGAGPWRGAG